MSGIDEVFGITYGTGLIGTAGIEGGTKSILGMAGIGNGGLLISGEGLICLTIAGFIRTTGCGTTVFVGFETFRIIGADGAPEF